MFHSLNICEENLCFISIIYWRPIWFIPFFDKCCFIIITYYFFFNFLVPNRSTTLVPLILSHLAARKLKGARNSKVYHISQFSSFYNFFINTWPLKNTISIINNYNFRKSLSSWYCLCVYRYPEFQEWLEFVFRVSPPSNHYRSWFSAVGWLSSIPKSGTNSTSRSIFSS